VVCIRSMEPGFEANLILDLLDPGFLRGRLASSRLVHAGPFGPGLPRETAITTLLPHVNHRLVVTVTDGRTPPVSHEAFFVPAGEERLVVNHPPQAVAQAPASVECGGAEGAVVRFDGSASSDPDADDAEIDRYDWTLDPGGPRERPLGSGAVLETGVPFGPWTVGLTVTDRYGETGASLFAVAVNDTAAPTLELSATPGVLWPPSHKRVHVRIAWSAADRCDPAPIVTLVGVTSSEPE